MYRTYITVHTFALFLPIIGNLFDVKVTTKLRRHTHKCMHEKPKKVIELPRVKSSTSNHHGVLNRRPAFLHVNSN